LCLKSAVVLFVTSSIGPCKSEVKITSELDLHLIFYISHTSNFTTTCFAQNRITNPVYVTRARSISPLVSF